MSIFLYQSTLSLIGVSYKGAVSTIFDTFDMTWALDGLETQALHYDLTLIATVV
jgi:hypothetical protein